MIYNAEGYPKHSLASTDQVGLDRSGSQKQLFTTFFSLSSSLRKLKINELGILHQSDTELGPKS